MTNLTLPGLSWLNRKADQLLAYLLVTSIALYYYKTAFWPLTYAFVGCYSFFAVLFLFRFRFRFALRGFIRYFFLPLILFVFYLISAIVTDEADYYVILKDITLIVVLFSFFYFLYWLWTYRLLNFSKGYAVNLIIFLTLAISVLNLLKLFSAAWIPQNILSLLKISSGNTLAADYNFFCLFVFIGLILVNFKIPGINYPGSFIAIFNVICIANVIISGSRRGIVLLLLLSLIYLIITCRKRKREGAVQGSFNKNLLFSVVLLISIGLFSVFLIPEDRITLMVHRYISLIGIDDYTRINAFLWGPKNSIDHRKQSFRLSEETIFRSGSLRSPDRNLKFRKVNSPYGNAVRISRNEPDGQALNIYARVPAQIYLANHNYRISFNFRNSDDNINLLNTGWQISDGARAGYAVPWDKKLVPLTDGWYSYESNYAFIDNHFGIVFFLNLPGWGNEMIITDITITDLSYDSTLPEYPHKKVDRDRVYSWMDEVNPPENNKTNLINNGNFRNGLNYWRFTADSLSVNIVDYDNKKCALIRRGNGNNGDWSLVYVGRKIAFTSNNEYQIEFKVMPVSPGKIPFYVGFWVDEGDGFRHNLDLTIDTLERGWLDVKASYRFKSDYSDIYFPINSQNDNSEFYITDISLTNLTRPQFHERTYISDSVEYETFMSSRFSRWKYGIELWKNEYKWHNKLGGHGLDFYKWYSDKFFHGDAAVDYPHNPFISILLYSGIIGILFYLWLIIAVLKYYIRYHRDYPYFLILFMITFYFSFFSSTHPYDPPIMGFFMVLPFFIHLTYTKKT